MEFLFSVLKGGLLEPSAALSLNPMKCMVKVLDSFLQEIVIKNVKVVSILTLNCIIVSSVAR